MAVDTDLMLSNMDESLVLLDRDFRILRLTGSYQQQFKRRFNLCPEPGMRLLDCLSPEERPHAERLYRKVLEGQREEREMEVATPDGAVEIHLVCLKPALDAQGEIVGILISVLDVTDRRRVEEGVSQSERRFRALVQDGSDLIAILDVEGNYLYVSPTSNYILGINAEDFIGKNAFDFIHRDDLEQMRAEFARLATEKRIDLKPFRFADAQGHWRWIQTVVTNLLDDPAVGGIVANSRDVTEQLQNERKVAFSERRFRTLVQNSGDLICVLDAKGHFGYVSPSYETLLGYRTDELLGLDAFSLHHPDDRPIIQAEFARVLESDERVISSIYRYRHKDGYWVYQRSVATNLLGDPAVQGVVVNSSVVTDLVQIRQQLEQSHERFERLVQASSDSILELDIATNAFYVSEGFAQSFGHRLPGPEHNRKFMQSLVHPDDFEDMLRSFSEAIADPGVEQRTASYRLRKADGDYARVVNHMVILRDEQGAAYRTLGTLRDVTREYCYQQLDELENRLMTRIMRDNPTREAILGDYIEALEALFPAMRGSIMEIAEDCLHTLVAPSLPKAYNQALDGMRIGPRAGSCGTAAWRQQPVIASNVMTDPLWEDYRHLAIEYDFKACWSQPIVNSQGRIVATFAGYYRDEHYPSELELVVIERTQQLIGLILDRYDFVSSLQQSNERYSLISRASRDAIYDWNIQADRVYWGKGLGSLFGHHLEPDESFSSADWEQRIHPDDRESCEVASRKFLQDAKARRWDMGYRFARADGTYAYVEETGYLVRDGANRPIRVVGVLRDVSDDKLEEIRQELEQTLGRLFTDRLNLKLVLQDVLHYLLDYSQFATGEIWLVDSAHQHLNLHSRVARDQQGLLFYEAADAVKRLTRGEGVPGKVWSSGLVQSWDNIDRAAADNPFVRQEAAARAGMKATLGIPLVHQGRVMGVLVFLADRAIGTDRTLVEPYAGLGTFLGAEISRKQQEYEMYLLFQSAPDIVAIASPRGHFVKVNPAFCELLGYSEDEIIGRPFADFLHPDDVTSTEYEFGITVTGERHAHNFVNRYRTCNGEYRWISWGSSDPFGEEGLVFSYGRDVTELRKLEQLLDTASRMARVGSWEYSVSDGRIFWSDVTREIHEVPASFVPQLDKAMNFYKVGSSRDRMLEAVEQAISTGLSYDLELQVVTFRGREKWVRTIGSAEFVDGKCVRLYGSFQDIDARKSVEVQFKAMANNVPGVIYQYQLRPDGTDRITYASEGAREIWGLDPEKDLVNMDKVWEGIVRAGDADYVRKTIQQSARTLEPWHASWRNVRPDGELRYHEGIGNPYRQADGTIVWDSLLLDVTDRHHLEELVQRSATMARIGSWELSFAGGNTEQMYWSPMTREILQVDADYNPTLTGGLELFTDESRVRVEGALRRLIKTAEDFDLELQVARVGEQPRWIRCIGTSERVGSKCSKIYGSFQDIDEHKSVQSDLARKNQYLAMASNVIGMLLRTENWFSVLQSIFKLIGESMAIDRICYLECQDGETGELQVSQRVEWVREPYRKHGEDTRFQNIPLQLVAPDIHGQLVQGYGVQAYLSALPEGDFRESLLDFDTQAVLLLPVIIDGRLYGILSFDDCQQEREWTEYEIWLLDSIASSMTAAIGRSNNQWALEQAFAERNAILESIGDGFATVDRDWTVTYWNRQAEILTGVSREDILGCNIWDIFRDAEDTDFYRHYEEVMAGAEAVSFEDYYAGLDKWFDISVYPSDSGISIFFKDITERRESQRRLQESNERFEKVSEATNDAIWDWNILTGTLYWGAGFQTLFGYDVKGETPSLTAWSDHIHEEDVEAVMSSLHQAVVDSHITQWQYEYRYKKADGGHAAIIDRGVIIRDASGKATRMVGAITDITERKRHEEALVRLNRQMKRYTERLEASNTELEQFAYIASHDLQEPLRMVSSFLKLLESRYGDKLDEEAKEYIDFAVDGALRMRRIILDLLNYSRVGKHRDALGQVDVAELLTEVRLLFRENLEQKQAQLSWDEMPRIETYRSPLLQVFQNLISNALKYSREGVPPRIRVTAADLGESWQFSVQDNGLGIDSRYFDKIFVIFQRLHAKDEYEGTGIGLSVVKKTLESLGGKIWLESEPGVGSTFHFTLPKSQLADGDTDAPEGQFH